MRDAISMPWCRRDLLRAAGGAALGSICGCAARTSRSPASELSTFEFAEMSVAELRTGLESGRWTAMSLCESYQSRIGEIDHAGPSLRSVIEINPDAMREAERLDAERREGRVRSRLHGVPIMLKDNIGTADAMQTTAGSLALLDSGVARDSGVAARLRAAGVLLIAKTNLSEWANFRSRQSTSGWSARGGLTLNPYFLDRNPCGSSSGSGVAVSAGIAPLAVGTETNGSIVCPSSVNGIVGVKPTVGLVSRSGIVPIAHTQDTAGPMARNVADAAEMLGPMAGPDPLDGATAEGRFREAYTHFLDAGAMHGARIGLLREYWGRHEAMDSLLENAARAMTDAGAELVDLESLPRIDETHRPGFEVMLYEFKDGLNRYLAELSPGAQVRSLEDLIGFNQRNRDAEMPYFGQDIFESAVEKGTLDEPEYRAALAISRDVSRQAIDATLAAGDLEALFAPTTGPAWVTDLMHGDRSSFPGCSSPAARAGYPHVTVPGGDVFGLPVGVSFFGTAWSEPRLLALAYAFEQATGHRKSPRMLPGGARLPT